MTPTPEQVLDWLRDVPDPEIPVVSVVDLGVVRDIDVVFGADGEPKVTVALTPTYSGCPATRVIAEDVRAAILSHGVADVSVRQVLSPPWTTDDISEAARSNLADYGIAPPSGRACDGAGRPAGCPQCGSGNTRLVSRFGSTPCKAQYVCDECQEPFDYFKCF